MESATSMSQSQEVNKYQKFIHELIQVTGYVPVSRMDAVASDLLYAIEHDCVDWDAMVRLFTGDAFESLSKGNNRNMSVRWNTHLIPKKTST